MSASLSVTARRVAAAALAAGALAAATAATATAAPAAADNGVRLHRPHVEISSVQPTSPGYGNRSNRSLNNEWADITNTSRRPVNLDGWTLSDQDGHTYTFRHYRLEGRSTVRVHTGIGRDSDTDLYQDRRDHVWDRRFDTATLSDDRDRVIDAASWGNDCHGPFRDDDRHGHDGRERESGPAGRDGHHSHHGSEARH
ncbi:lamin tail domain-containing protein [Streptomyces sp. NPDC058252]|uniref:lamin tail domain-containing protein n=1 Tax=Streptomyces sp. NPDC058252 TaxID=3346405 RepID=UPI0036E54261